MSEVIDFTLPAETLERLGLNADYSEKEETATEAAAEGATDVAAEGSEVASKGAESSEVDKEETKETGAGDSNSESFDFDKELQDILVRYKDPESKRQLLKDLKNHEKFMAANTQRAQELAEMRRNLESERSELSKLTERLRVKEIRELIEGLSEERLAELDERFADPDDPYDDGRDKNVLRRIKELYGSLESGSQLSEAEQSIIEEKSRLQVERELLELSRITGESYDIDNPSEWLNELADEAVKLGVDLITAYKVREYEGSKDELDKLRAELKAANKQLNEYRKRYPDMGVGVLGGKGSRREEYPVGSFEEATNSIKKQLGIGE